jgi:hypothetical protein
MCCCDCKTTIHLVQELKVFAVNESNSGQEANRLCCYITTYGTGADRFCNKTAAHDTEA